MSAGASKVDDSSDFSPHARSRCIGGAAGMDRIPVHAETLCPTEDAMHIEHDMPLYPRDHCLALSRWLSASCVEFRHLRQHPSAAGLGIRRDSTCKQFRWSDICLAYHYIWLSTTGWPSRPLATPCSIFGPSLCVCRFGRRRRRMRMRRRRRSSIWDRNNADCRGHGDPHEL